MNEISKILVTGGAGFVGRHLCDYLLNENHQVICLDNFYTGKRDNIQSFLNHPNFQLLEFDVCDKFDLEVDAIYHLACPASPIHYQQQPIETTKTSVLGAIHVLDLASKHQIPVLLASTSEVYGCPSVHPQTEDYFGNVNSIGPRACYDEGKRCAESLFMDYHRTYGTDIRIARIFNTYGPYMAKDDGRVVSNFICQALSQQSLTIYGDGTQTRSFCYIDDLVSGLVSLMRCKDTHIPVNLGNPYEQTMNQIAKTILNKTHSTSALSYLPLPKDDPKQRCPDISRAKALLNWQPQVPFDLGIQHTIEYFDKMITQPQTSLRTSSKQGLGIV